MKQEPSGLVAETVSIAAVDLSLAQSARAGAEGWLSLCAEVRRLVDSVLFSHGGVPVAGHQSTHEFAYAFSRASSAVEALVELQRECLKSDPGHGGVSLRSAVFTGEVGASYGGTPLEQAVALKNLSNIHQILVTLAVRELSRQQVSEGIDFRDMDMQRLTESLPAQKVFQVLAPGLPSEFPSLRALDSTYTNLASPVNGFVGRERDTYEVVSRLRASRLVTLVGPAGIGKSRLAMEVGRIMLHEYPDGVFAIDFEDLSQASFIMETIASELPFVERATLELLNQMRQELVNKQILIILDNCDDVREDLAKQAEALFGGFRGVEILITSREPLGLSGEAIFAVPPLDDRSNPTAFEWEQSYALLAQHLREAVPGHSLSADVRGEAIELCRLLRGVPLAIELISTKLRVNSLADVCEQIASASDHSLSQRPEDLQELVEKIVKLVYGALTAGEQKVFRRASAFVRGWDLPAAEYVCSDEILTAAEVGRCANLLVQKGLFRRLKKGPHRHRDQLMPSLRPFAQILVKACDEEDALRQRHLDWFVKVADRASKEMSGPNQHQELDSLHSDRGNIRVAIEWALSGAKNLQAAYDLVLGVHKYWYRRGLYTEGQLWTNRLLADSGFELSERRARALNVVGIFLTACGDSEAAITYHEHSLDIGKKLGLQSVVGSNLANIGICNRGLKKLDKAIKAFEASAEALRAVGEEQMLASTLSNLGACLLDSARCEDAVKALRESLTLNEKLGNDWTALMVRFNLAQVALRQNAYDEAEPLLTQSMRSWFEQQDYRGVSMALRSMAVLAEKLEQPERAAVLLGASASLRSRLHQELPPIEVAYFQELNKRLSSSIGDAAFFRKWSEGNNLSAHAAVTFAVGTSNAQA